MAGIADILKKKRARKRPDPAKEERRHRRDQRLNRVALLLHVLFSVAGYFLIETMARHSAGEALAFVLKRPRVFFYNALLILLTTLPAFLTRKRAFVRVLAASLWLGLGAANGIILANRVTPLTGPDLLMISDAYRVAGKYFSPVEIAAVTGLVILGIAALIRYLIVSPVYRGKMYRRFVLPALIACAAGFAGLTAFLVSTRDLSTYFSNIAYAYLDYGFPYSLCVTLFDTGISEPNGYSEELVEQVIAGEGEPVETKVTDDMPNIIMVQLESFFDPTRVKGLKLSEDPLPNWHRLKETCSSGYYRVPTVGAGTVNTEFETLTGMSLRFFGAGEYPYKGILLKETCESLPYVLSTMGYAAHAIHNNEADFYGRRNVYSYLGFNSFTSSEYMNTQNDVNENDWMRDRHLIPCIGDALDSTPGRDFVFAVSVQPHGAYPTEPVLSSPPVTVSGADSAGEKNAWEYYISQLVEEDQFVADLIEELDKREEPVIVFFYGDHLPTMGLADRDLTGAATVFDTDYLIWSNREIDERTRRIASYQAAAEVLDLAGIHSGVMFRYHQTMRLMGNYFANMEILQYDMLYGKRYVYGKTNPWSKTILAMGVLPVRVDRIRRLGEEGMYEVKGENFTQSCIFQKNGEAVDTTYLDGNTLIIRNTELERGDWVGVAVRSNESGSKEILGTSNTLVYGAGRLVE